MFPFAPSDINYYYKIYKHIFFNIAHHNFFILKKNMQPSLWIVACTPFWDLGLGDFILMKSKNLKLYYVWMERVESEVVKDE